MIRSWTHDGLVIAVVAGAEEIDWLEEMLSPAFASTAATPHVHILCDGPPISPPLAPPTDLPVAFAFDSGPIRWPAARIARGWQLRDTFGRAIAVAAAGREVRVEGLESPSAGRFLVLRVVREYAHNHSIATGGVVLHAAAVCAEGRAVAIAGSKGSGKTTLALRLLSRQGVSYLSNDRVLVRPTASPHATAVPTVVALRAGTRALLPDVARRLSDCGDFREHTAERQRRGPSPPAITGDTWYLSPRQLCERLACSMEGAAPLAAVLFTTSHRASHAHLRRLEVDEAARALTGSVLCRESGQFTSEVFRAGDRHSTDAAGIEAACAALGRTVPCFECSLPEIPLEDDESILTTCLHSSP